MSWRSATRPRPPAPPPISSVPSPSTASSTPPRVSASTSTKPRATSASTAPPAEDKPAAETEIPSGGDVKKPEESGEVGDYAKKAEELLGGTGEKSGAEGLLKAAG
ncbi:hypothetical protein SASPL_117581 [Salvia splendens]|uniref:Uncharacterized protein n=1 Tax=Salvia splendens TaxID=180675 RepID=A0A8X8ZXQ4_SALSN|nr:hypothetical protein SASPL_117581 [Salvia splendens]